MSQLIVGIGDYKVSNGSEDIIKTYALGSCVAVIIYDKKLRIAGMIHIALPDSKIDQEKARNKPAYFADTGLSFLIEEMKKLGVLKENIWIKMVGGANVMQKEFTFDIGKRNILAIKKILWKQSLRVIASDVGGSISRTVSVGVQDGEIEITSGKETWKL